MLKRLLFFVWLALPLEALCQNLRLIDSLEASVPFEETEKRFHTLNDLAWEFRFAYPDSTLYYSNAAFELGKRIGIKKGLARPINVMGVAYNYKGERVNAFEHYSDALEIAKVQQDSIQIAHANNNIGRLFFEQGMLSRSYEYFVKARTIFRAINDSSGVAYAHQSLANLYSTQRDYQKAEDSFLKAYQIRLMLGNSRDIMSAMVYLGKHYLGSSNPDKAIEFFSLADSTGHVIEDEINLAEIKTYLAESYLSKGLLKEAEDMAKEGLAVIQRRNNLRMLPHAYLAMGQILLRQDNVNRAKSYFQLALDIASKMKDLDSKMESYYFLWKISEGQNNKAESIMLQNQYLILKDSIKDLDLVRQVERLQFQIGIQRKERENELLKAAQLQNAAIIQQQKLQNIILIGLVAFVSIVGVLQWANAKKKRFVNEKLIHQNTEIQQQRLEIGEHNEALSARNAQLSELNHEKDTLMSIVAHDLRSPLNRIEGIIYLMENDGRLSKDHQEYLEVIKDAMRSGLDLITDLLDVHMLEESVLPNYESFDISAFLLEKVDAFQHRALAKNIHLSIARVENEDVFTDRGYLDRIFDNLLSNAIKFSSRNSMIEISADRTDREFWISIKDSGPGFSNTDKESLFQKFKKLSARPTAGESSNGLGLAIVKILTDRLKGKIELQSEQGKGSQFTIRFPQEPQLVPSDATVR